MAMFDAELFEMVDGKLLNFSDFDFEQEPQIGDILEGCIKIVRFLDPEEDGADYRIVVEFVATV